MWFDPRVYTIKQKAVVTENVQTFQTPFSSLFG
jgi:hypothetical protein